MAKQKVSLNITIEATQEQMEDENVLRELCIQKMREILGFTHQTLAFKTATDGFRDQVTIEPFDGEIA